MFSVSHVIGPVLDFDFAPWQVEQKTGAGTGMAVKRSVPLRLVLSHEISKDKHKVATWIDTMRTTHADEEHGFPDIPNESEWLLESARMQRFIPDSPTFILWWLAKPAKPTGTWKEVKSDWTYDTDGNAYRLVPVNSSIFDVLNFPGPIRELTWTYYCPGFVFPTAVQLTSFWQESGKWKTRRWRNKMGWSRFMDHIREAAFADVVRQYFEIKAIDKKGENTPYPEIMCMGKRLTGVTCKFHNRPHSEPDFLEDIAIYRDDTSGDGHQMVFDSLPVKKDQVYVWEWLYIRKKTNDRVPRHLFYCLEDTHVAVL